MRGTATNSDDVDSLVVDSDVVDSDVVVRICGEASGLR